MSWRTEIDDTKHSRLSLTFENDPGRRNRSLVGARHLRNILSMHVVAGHLLLIRFGQSFDDSYWSYLTPNGNIVEIGHDLNKRLSRLPWSNVQTCIVKG